MRAASLLALAVAAAGVAHAAPAITAASIDATVARAMRQFDVPGVAVAVVKDGQVAYAKGFGARALGQLDRVDVDTVFQIGSNTKAFTTAALSMLVDEGKLTWDDKVIDRLPQFRLYDPYVTREFTVRDLLTHRSGLGEGAGDLMFYPATDFSRAEIVRGLRHLKPVSGFRAKYNYDNLLYMVAGELVAAVTGTPWEDFVERRIFQPLQLKSCAADHSRLKAGAPFAAPHTVVDGKLTRIPVEDIRVIGAAGTINCSLRDMTTWLQTQLGEGVAPNGIKLFTPERAAEMWTLNTVEEVDPVLTALLRTHFKGYGLGWYVSDEFGFKRVAHTGGVPGTSTWVAMIPELKLGVLVFTNHDDGSAMEAIGNSILDAYVGAPKRDLVALLAGRAAGIAKEAAAAEAEVKKTLAAGTGVAVLPLKAYAGRFNDVWRGEATVDQQGDRLRLKFGRTTRLEGVLTPYLGNVFIVRWAERSLNADAFVRFSQTFDGSIDGFTMRAVSPTTNFSFDFQDLNFVRTP
jgi:CubicO group peptidase (beta-lactamase class C family)